MCCVRVRWRRSVARVSIHIDPWQTAHFVRTPAHNPHAHTHNPESMFVLYIRFMFVYVLCMRSGTRRKLCFVPEGRSIHVHVGSLFCIDMRAHNWTFEPVQSGHDNSLPTPRQKYYMLKYMVHISMICAHIALCLSFPGCQPKNIRYASIEFNPFHHSPRTLRNSFAASTFSSAPTHPHHSSTSISASAKQPAAAASCTEEDPKIRQTRAPSKLGKCKCIKCERACVRYTTYRLLAAVLSLSLACVARIRSFDSRETLAFSCCRNPFASIIIIRCGARERARCQIRRIMCVFVTKHHLKHTHTRTAERTEDSCCRAVSCAV